MAVSLVMCVTRVLPGISPRFVPPSRFLCSHSFNMKVKDCYLLLGVDWGATVVDVREAYLRLAKLYHPDCGRSTADAAKFSEIEEAYRVVMDHVTTLESAGPEIIKDDSDKERFEINHTAPQHRYSMKN